MFDVNYTYPPYATTFPEIVDCLSFRPCVPVNVNITDNIYCNAETFISTTGYVAWNDTVTGNVEKCPPV